MARKILLADDSVTAQNMGRRILTDAGYEVTTVNNGSAALKKIAESKPDLIVLDVYMPGYGGLEVCQRLRESHETSRIPVLLTVGKLEPFKAEEARRVRADAFIVKPFEASELLTALTKLEDRIVPAPQHKTSHFAKALAAVDTPMGGEEKEFGDIETGWKERIKIPPPHPPKHHEVHEASPEKPQSAPASEKPKSAEVAASLEEAVRARMPDITPEEVAAIQAAAAILGRQAEELGTSFQEAQEPAEKPIGKPEVVEEPPAPPVAAQVEVPQEVAQQAEQEVAQVDVAAEATQAAPVVTGKLAAEEVDAALAGIAAIHQETAREQESLPVTMAAVAAEEYSGPRWIAEPVALTDSESSMNLEEEMRRAFSSFAAADAARMGMAELKDEEIVSDGDEMVSEREASRAEQEPVSAAMRPAADVEEETKELPVVAAPQPEVVELEIKQDEGAAFAAAASAGVVAVSVASVRSAEAELPLHSQENASQSAAAQGEAELAAAWESWKQVRDSVASPLFTAKMADAAAAGLKEAREEAKSSSDSSTNAAEDNVAIASIVDSVLAELKPKLMEEIAKKMGKEKK